MTTYVLFVHYNLFAGNKTIRKKQINIKKQKLIIKATFESLKTFKVQGCIFLVLFI